MYQLLLPIIFSASVIATGPISLPPNFQICPRSDSNHTGCIVPAVQSAIRELVKGSRPLGVLPIDPLQILTLGINQGAGPVAITLDFNDFAIKGISKVIVESVDTQLDGDVKSLKLKVKAPAPLVVEGGYTINGKVLILPITGTGYSKIELFDTSASLTFIGKLVTKDGKEYLELTTETLDLNPSKVSFYFENLFNGDKALGDNMNVFLNENWMEIWTELKHAIEKAFGTTLMKIANLIFSKVPFDAIFPAA